MNKHTLPCATMRLCAKPAGFYIAYLSSERVLVRPAGHWGLPRSQPPELRGASWGVRGCGEPCWEKERSGRGCCCSSDDGPRVGCCQWQPVARPGSWGLSSRTHTGKGISCTWRTKHTCRRQIRQITTDACTWLVLASSLRPINKQLEKKRIICVVWKAATVNFNILLSVVVVSVQISKSPGRTGFFFFCFFTCFSDRNLDVLIVSNPLCSLNRPGLYKHQVIPALAGDLTRHLVWKLWGEKKKKTVSMLTIHGWHQSSSTGMHSHTSGMFSSPSGHTVKWTSNIIHAGCIMVEQ